MSSKLRCQNCQGLPGFPCSGAVVLITWAPSGNKVMTCLYALNLILDNADDEPDMEPAGLRWMYGPDSNYHGALSDPATGEYQRLVLSRVQHANA